MIDKTYEEVSEAIATAATKVVVSLTSTSTHAQAMKAIDGVCTALHGQEVSIEHTRRVLGKTLAMIQDHKLYEPEFTSYTQLEASLTTRYRVSRATLRDSLFIARRLPDLTTEQAEAIPMASLTLVARAAKDARPNDVRMLMKDAERMPLAEFRTSVANRGLIASGPVGQVDTVRLTFAVSKSTAERWTKLVGERDATTVFIDAINLLWKDHAIERKPMSNTSASRSAVTRKAA